MCEQFAISSVPLTIGSVELPHQAAAAGTVPPHHEYVQIWL
jgi:hypothetical protein